MQKRGNGDMGKLKKVNNAISALSQLKEEDYGAINEDLKDIYARLENGRNAFASVYELNTNVVAKISAMDLDIKFYIEQLLKIAESVAQSSDGIYQAAADATEVAGVVSGRHEDLTNTILEVSEESANVLNKIETGQSELTDIRQLSNQTITASETMSADMDNLSEVIGEMTKVIDGINAISSQTNLLSLNASIEAARAGEAGKGFAVVADEIRSLADETKTLTTTMSEFVEGVRTASSKSVESVGQAIEALKTVNNKIGDVWALNEENEKHVAAITDSISNLAAVSEEISSSMMEIEARSAEIEEACQTLNQDAQELNEIGKNSAEALEPLEHIEGDVDLLLGQMGKLSEDPFYALSREELCSYLDAAISAHRGWIERLRNIVETREFVPFQLDGNKCHFGHFYNSIEPQIPELKSVWKKIGEDHRALHHSGTDILKCIFDENYDRANSLFQSTEAMSVELVGVLSKVKSMVPEQSSVH